MARAIEAGSFAALGARRAVRSSRCFPPPRPGARGRRSSSTSSQGETAKGGRLYGGLVIGKDGLLYGTTSCQKPNHAGCTVFELKR